MRKPGKDEGRRRGACAPRGVLNGLRRYGTHQPLGMMVTKAVEKLVPCPKNHRLLKAEAEPKTRTVNRWPWCQPHRLKADRAVKNTVSDLV